MTLWSAQFRVTRLTVLTFPVADGGVLVPVRSNVRLRLMWILTRLLEVLRLVGTHGNVL